MAEIGEAAALERTRMFRADVDGSAVIGNGAVDVALAEMDAAAIEQRDSRLRIESDRLVEVAQRIFEVATARISESARDVP